MSAIRRDGAAFWLTGLALCGACGRGAQVEAFAGTAPEPPRLHPIGEVREVYHGTAEAPVAGLLLGPRPTVFFHDPARQRPEHEAQQRLAEDESVILARDWTRHVRTTFAPAETALLFDERTSSHAARAGLALDSVGRMNVVWTAPDELEGRFGRLTIFDLAGESLFDGQIGRLEWVEVAARGERAALGSRGETVVVDRRGQHVARLPPAERGALSADGAWLALEQADERGRRLTLVRPGAEALEFKATEAASALVFDGTGTRFARVGPRLLQLYRLDGERAALESERVPPEGFAWRSAAFAADGRLGLGRIHVVRRPARQPANPPVPDTAGEAWLGTEILSPAGEVLSRAQWPVADWNHRAPQLAFDAAGALFVVAWPSAYEVRP